jgi:hypothetical protein
MRAVNKAYCNLSTPKAQQYILSYIYIYIYSFTKIKKLKEGRKGIEESHQQIFDHNFLTILTIEVVNLRPKPNQDVVSQLTTS